MTTETNQTALPPVASLSKRDYAKHHSVSERTVDYWRVDGMPCLLVSSRKVLFPVADCDQWVRDRFLIARGAAAKWNKEASK
jgi:hypothetical protein